MANVIRKFNSHPYKSQISGSVVILAPPYCSLFKASNICIYQLEWCGQPIKNTVRSNKKSNLNNSVSFFGSVSFHSLGATYLVLNLMKVSYRVLLILTFIHLQPSYRMRTWKNNKKNIQIKHQNNKETKAKLKYFKR